MVLLAGATGLVGRQVYAAIGAETHILSRKPLDGLPDNVAQHVADPAKWPEIVAGLKVDVAISCLGTTWKKSGRDTAAFRAVDHDLVLAFAVAAKLAGAKHFITVSSVGASARARGFYLRTKGETEDALAAMEFARLDILRPGLLLGARTGDPRLAEGFGMILSPLTNLLTPQRYSKFKAIPAVTVAAAIAHLITETTKGHFVHENDAICAFAS